MLETKEKNLDLLAYELAPVGIVMTKSRVIVACNPAFAKMFGYERDELVNQLFKKLYPSEAEFHDVRHVSDDALRERNRYTDERVMARKDGSLFWCRVRGVTLTTEGDPLAHCVWSLANLAPERPVVQLTARERQIMMHLTVGRTCKETAQHMNVTYRTVEAYRARLLKKFNAANVTELLLHVGIPEKPNNRFDWSGTAECEGQ